MKAELKAQAGSDALLLECYTHYTASVESDLRISSTGKNMNSYTVLRLLVNPMAIKFIFRMQTCCAQVTDAKKRLEISNWRPRKNCFGSSCHHPEVITPEPM